MSRFPFLLALLCGAAPCLSVAAPSRSDPLDARAIVPPAVAPRSIAPSRPVDDPPAVAWHTANDRVGRIGGWRAYARETLPPEASR